MRLSEKFRLSFYCSELPIVNDIIMTIYVSLISIGPHAKTQNDALDRILHNRSAAVTYLKINFIVRVTSRPQKLVDLKQGNTEM